MMSEPNSIYLFVNVLLTKKIKSSVECVTYGEALLPSPVMVVFAKSPSVGIPKSIK